MSLIKTPKADIKKDRPKVNIIIGIILKTARITPHDEYCKKIFTARISITILMHEWIKLDIILTTGRISKGKTTFFT